MNRSLTIICIHGVGLWPGLFDGLDFGSPAESMIRPGYGGLARSIDLNEQVQVLARLIETRAPAAVVGVSGGATLALACAVAGLPGLVAAVSHEPLIGQLEPDINDRVRVGADSLEAHPTAASSLSFLQGLYGKQSWEAMPSMAHEWAADHAESVCREVRHFSEYQPSATELRELPLPHLTTVGARSNAARHRVAMLLQEGGSRACTIEESGHHVLVDQPHRFATTVRQFLSEVTDVGT